MKDVSLKKPFFPSGGFFARPAGDSGKYSPDGSAGDSGKYSPDVQETARRDSIIWDKHSLDGERSPKIAPREHTICRSKSIIAIFVLLLLSVTHTIFAQTTSTIRFGAHVAGAWNLHLGNFSELPNIPACCPEYRLGLGFGGSAGINFDIALASRLFLALRADAALQTATFLHNEPVLLSVDGARIDGVFRHSLAVNPITTGLGVMLAWKPFLEERSAFLPLNMPGLSIYAGGVGRYVIQSPFRQREDLQEPIGRARYLDGTRERNLAQGANLPSLHALQGLLTLGFGYDIALGEMENLAYTFILTPEVFAEYALTPLVRGLEWRMNAVRGGISLRYAVPPPELPLPPIPPKDPLTYLSQQSKAAASMRNRAIDEAITKETAPQLAPPPKILRTPLEILTNAPGDDLKLIINAVAVDSTGKESALVRVVTEEFISTQMYPLLPYIFFDRFSAMIPARYQRLATKAASDSFDEARLTNAETLEVYYHLLNIIGQRMKSRPAATLRIVGCLGKMGFGPDSEENAPDIAQRRADAVKEYLQFVWGIPQNRLKTEARGLPEKFSNAANADIGEEDNRRVELYSDDWNILKPVQIGDTLRISNPPDVMFRMQAFWRGRVANVTEWAVDILQNKRFMLQVRDNAALPPEYRWKLNARRTSAPRTNVPLEFTLQASDDAGREGEAFTQIPVELKTVQEKRSKRIQDKEIDEYRLINFAFEKAEISPELERILQENIRPNIKAESQVFVRGFTDKSGNDAVNQRISEARAEAVSTAIGLGKRTAKGLGSSIVRYPNDVPEGRFYARTVEVRVETPVR
jgi:outer membrane protein OmpA-like peptidoglycan-associated protein